MIANEILAFDAVNADHFSTEQVELIGRERAGENVAGVQDADAFEWLHGG